MGACLLDDTDKGAWEMSKCKVLCITPPVKGDKGWSCIMHIKCENITRSYHSGYWSTRKKLMDYIDSIEKRF